VKRLLAGMRGPATVLPQDAAAIVKQRSGASQAALAYEAGGELER
jgi:hypothetical protein